MGLILLGGLLGVGRAVGILKPPPGQQQIEPVCLEMSVIFTLLGILWFLIRPLARKGAIRKQFAQLKDQGIELQWLVIPEKVALKSRLGSSEFSWEAVLKVVQTPVGFLVFVEASVAHWLPRRGFASEVDFERFGQLAMERAPDFFQLP